MRHVLYQEKCIFEEKYGILYSSENQAMLNISYNWVISYGICFSAAHYDWSVSSSLDNMWAVVRGTGRTFHPRLKEDLGFSTQLVCAEEATYSMVGTWLAYKVATMMDGDLSSAENIFEIIVIIVNKVRWKTIFWNF